MFNDHGSGDAPSCVPHKVFKERELLRGKFDRTTRAAYLSLNAVQVQVLHLEDRFGGEPPSPQQGSDSRREFGE
jgi:hypothetical protein